MVSKYPKMFVKCVFWLILFNLVSSYVQKFKTEHFKVGIEYDHSLPMTGGSDRYRHRNNYEPFFVTATASAKKGYVISYLEVRAITDDLGEVEFHVIRGDSGSKTLVFNLMSNNSDFLYYSYLTYGIKEEEYKKMTNIISIPIGKAESVYRKEFCILLVVLLFRALL